LVSQFGATMICMKYLWKHTGSGIWHYRRAIPADTQGRLGKSVRINLKTKNDFEAVKLVIPLIERTDRQIAEMRSGRKFTDEQLNRMALDWIAYYEVILHARRPLPSETNFPPAIVPLGVV
jgi:hypothetical protein